MLLLFNILRLSLVASQQVHLKCVLLCIHVLEEQTRLMHTELMKMKICGVIHFHHLVTLPLGLLLHAAIPTSAPQSSPGFPTAAWRGGDPPTV